MFKVKASIYEGAILIPKYISSHILMHEIDKHEGKKIIVVKTFKVKGPRK
jgi:hypothetical protein